MSTQGSIQLPVSGIPSVANVGALPAVGLPGQAYIAIDTGVIYGWSVTNSAWEAPAGSGTVTSVGLDTTSAAFLTVGSSPVTSAGTITLSLAVQNKNKAFIGPTTGADAAPTFRLLVGADLPLPGSSSLGGVFSKAAVSHQFLTAIVAADGSVTSAQPAFSDISGTAAAGQLPLPGAASLGGVFSKAAVSHQFLTAIVAADGSVTSAQPAFSDISSTLAGAQLPTFTGDVTNSSAAMTVAKIAGVAVGTPTGTTNVVFSDSPNFSTKLTFGNYHLEPSENNAGNSGTTLTVDLSTGSAQKITLTGNVTLTLTNPVTGGTYVFKIFTGAGSFTVTWPATVKWPSGTAPTITTTASRADLVSLYWDGTDYFGTFAQNYTP